jgi:hypothetical protein
MKQAYKLILLGVAAAVCLFAFEPIRHPNGTVAFWNCGQAYNCNHAVYHSNGTVASWNCGQAYNCNHAVYHSNGKVAFWNCGTAYNCNTRVFYSNGSVAWDGNRNGVCYHPNGSIQRQGCNGVAISLGEGIDLTVSSTASSISVYGEQILL